MQVRATSGVHFIYPNVKVRVTVKEEEIYIVTTKESILILILITYTGIHNYGNANWLQYIFERDPTKTIENTSQL